MESHLLTRSQQQRDQSEPEEVLVNENSSNAIVIDDLQVSSVSPASRKRPFEVIDLTMDSEEESENEAPITLPPVSTLSQTRSPVLPPISSTIQTGIPTFPEPPEREGTYRECSACTFHNHPALLECEMCGTSLFPENTDATPEQLQELQFIEMDRVLALQLQQELGWGPQADADEDEEDEEDEDDDDDDEGNMNDFDSEEDNANEDSEDDNETDSDVTDDENNENPQNQRRASRARPRPETTPTRPEVASGACGICLEEYSRLEYGSSICPDAFCVECWHIYLETKIKDHKFPCRCPAPRCRSVVTPDDAARLFRLKAIPSISGNQAGYANSASHSTKDFEAMIKTFKSSHEEATMQNKIYCPIMNCSRPLQFDPKTAITSRIYCPGPEDLVAVASTSTPSNSGAADSEPIVVLDEQGHWICAICLVSWHVKLTCKAFQHLEREKGNAGTLEEQQTLSAIRNQKLQKCPSCGFWVAKRNGCNHIVCVCGEDFCYRCGKSYNTKPKCRGDH